MDKAVKATILDILSKQTDMTIATLREDQYPQATTVSYVNDGLDIYISVVRRGPRRPRTSRATTRSH
jgi:nitroimidazol reductase NimA-like FMN-containing flavoprotein (pyridoxamine 5'-phosphate oxidase superfamily)